MNTRFSLLFLLTTLILAVVVASPGKAQTDPVRSVEDIKITLESQPPSNVFEQFYPNVYDLTHPKKLTFEGTVTNASSAPAFVDMWFDWIDPNDPSGTPPRTSGVIPIDLPPGATLPFGLPGGPPAIMFTIPFCPPQVSIHFQNNGPGAPVVIDGHFIHECMIPEPASLALLGLGLASFAGILRRSKSRI